MATKAVRIKQADGTWQDIALMGPPGPAGPGINLKGNVANQAALPSTGNVTGDAYQTNNDGHLWSWSGTAWIDNGMFRGATGYDTAQIGAVISTTRSTWSDEYVLANGQSLAEASYPDAITAAVAEVAAGNPFWTVTGTAPNRTCTVPDLRDRFLFGAGARAIGIMSQTNPALANPGEESHLLKTAEAAQKAVASGTENSSLSHAHPMSSSAAGGGAIDTLPGTLGHVGIRGGTVFGAGGAMSIRAEAAAYANVIQVDAWGPAAHTHNVAGSDAASAHNNMPPYAVLVFIVKVKGVSTSASVIQGPTGPTGPGVPVGGTTGQALVKKSGTNYDTEWGAAVGGGGSAGAPIVRKAATDLFMDTSYKLVPGLTHTITIAGTYKIDVILDIQCNANSTAIANVYKNGVSVGDPALVLANSNAAPLRSDVGQSLALALVAGDVIEVRASAANNVAYVNGIHSSMTIYTTQGPKGDAGPQVEYAAQATAGTNTSVGSGAFVKLPIGPTTTSTGTSNEFVRNSDGTITVKQAGWYTMTANCWADITANTALFRIAYALNDAVPDGNTFLVYVNAKPVYTAATLAWTAQLAANTRLAIFGYQEDGATRNLSVQAFGIARVGAGPKGDKGDVGGNATVPLDPWHIVGAAGEPALVAGVTRYTTESPLAFRKDPLGRVMLRGSANCPAGGTALFTLPVGYRPPADYVRFACEDCTSNTVLNVYVQANGTVSKNGSPTTVDVSSVEFDTETVTAMPTGPQGPTGPGGVARTWRGVDTSTIRTATTGWTEASSLLRVALAPVTTRFYTLRFVGQFEHNTVNNYVAMWFYDVATGAQLPGTYFVKRFPVANTNETSVFEQTLRGSDFPAGTRTISPYWTTAAGTCSLRSDAAMTTFTITETEAGT